MIGQGLFETAYMTLCATAAAYLIGLPLGVLLVITRKNNILPIPWLNAILGAAVNVLRSVPFLILMIFVIPLTRLVMGTTIKSYATIMPLFIAAFPFVSRMVEQSLAEVDQGVVEAAQSMGATTFQIVRKVLLPEAVPALANGAAITTTNVLGYSAMAGAVGGGGLGTLAINYGYYRYESGVMLVCIVILVLLVQVIQYLGTRFSVALDHRIK